jgi:hypothetical protein
MQHTVDSLMALHDDAAEKRHANGAPVYNTVSAHAREALRTALTEALTQPVPPHECKTYEEKLAYAAGWWKALEANSAQPSTDDNLRLKFESEYRRLYPVLCDIRPNKFERDGEDSYAETIVNVAWNLFKAAQPVREPLTAQVLHDFSPIFGGDK